MHDLTIITMLTTALVAALALGWLTQWVGFSPIVGYLLAGIVVGPHTPGFVANINLANQFAEIGVIFLMFGIGLQFHWRELVKVWKVAIPGALSQSLIATFCGWILARFFGWDSISGIILGMGLAVASTVVMLRMLEEQNYLKKREGQIAVGWLIVEDIFTVIVLVIMPALAVPTDQGANTAHAVFWAIVKVCGFGIFLFLLGPIIISPFLKKMAQSKFKELFTLSVFVFALSIATIASSLFQVSIALGAFLGGLVVAQSGMNSRAAKDILPFRAIFSALFFVSVGMLFDPIFVLDHPVMTLSALTIICIIKPISAFLLVLLLRGKFATAWTIGICLAQIGEFSFILASLGYSLGLLPDDGYDLFVACALISIALNPLLFRLPFWKSPPSSQ
ncbi:MAG TPA: cation:proton antiporter [Gammaproteobacteria bacterium]|nr:cation:proton antiporter [Gammaproteobacteria bacterium]